MLRWMVVLAMCSACGRDRAETAAFAEVLEKYATAPSTSVVVEHHGEIVLERALGEADLENHVPATPDTVYCIGSISKQFGAAAIMQLVEDGKVGLDDRSQSGCPRSRARSGSGSATCSTTRPASSTSSTRGPGRRRWATRRRPTR